MLESFEAQYHHYRDVRARINAPRTIVPKGKPRTIFLVDDGRPLSVKALDLGYQADSHYRYYCARINAGLPTIITLPKKYPSVAAIQKAVADAFEVSIVDLMSQSKAHRFITPRHIAMYLSKKLTKRSTPDIGQRFGGRDHSTVFHACKKMEACVLHSEEIASKIAEIELSVTGPA